MRICVGNLKGGTGKTTSSVHLALGLSRLGRTLLVDADPGQSGCVEWSELAGDEWPADRCTVVARATRDITRHVSPLMENYEHLVIDTGPKNPLMLRMAMALTDHLVVPLKPTSHDYPEVEPTFELAAEVDAVHPITASVLLVDVDSRWTTAREAREELAKNDVACMDAHIRHLVRFAMSRGTAPLADLGDYETVLAELQEEEASPA
jgi:chromosome partitioning protein